MPNERKVSEMLPSLIANLQLLVSDDFSGVNDDRIDRRGRAHGSVALG